MISKVISVLKQYLEWNDNDFVRWATLANRKLAMVVYKSLYITKRNIIVNISKLKECMFLTNIAFNIIFNHKMK